MNSLRYAAHSTSAYRPATAGGVGAGETVRDKGDLVKETHLRWPHDPSYYHSLGTRYMEARGDPTTRAERAANQADLERWVGAEWSPHLSRVVAAQRLDASPEHVGRAASAVEMIRRGSPHIDVLRTLLPDDGGGFHVALKQHPALHAAVKAMLNSKSGRLYRRSEEDGQLK